ncbi:hypothetical protein EJ419_05730 [Alloscardovia theropitheci]|uniref:Uncharacterized protein n=1 Tax=Alloscardovia theropitheci TaxID=2496842 RepID=A0A4R0QZA8_9BIFI|nr:hypothetical protein [Alloscardovia theropitheci]TCD53936.1 hypothetical protein EJ419_05730 [Alloscardovia theropitheci]
MSSYVRQNRVVKVSRNYNCGASVRVNRYTHVDIENYSDATQTCTRISYETISACFDPETSCDKSEREIIKAIKDCLRPENAPEALYERLRECMDCLCD